MYVVYVFLLYVLVIDFLKKKKNYLKNNPVENAIKTFENHPSIIKIKTNISPTQKVLFAFLKTDDI